MYILSIDSISFYEIQYTIVLLNKEILQIFIVEVFLYLYLL